MALGDPYATTPELEARLGSDPSWSHPQLLDAASRRVEQFCHRQFNKTATATARTFRPVDDGLTIVDDFHTVTGLVVAVDGDGDGVFETVWTTADYQLEPANGVVGGEAGWPFWLLRAVNRSFPWRTRNTVSVTAQWGWLAVPEGVREATLAVAEDMHSKSPGRVRSEAIDGYSTSYVVDDEMLGPFETAGPYRRHEGFA